MLSRLYMKLIPPSLETHLRNIDQMLTRGCSPDQLLRYMQEWSLSFEDSIPYCDYSVYGDSVALSICRHDRADLLIEFYGKGLMTLRERMHRGFELYMYCSMIPSAPRCLAYITHANHSPDARIANPQSIEIVAIRYAHDFPDAYREYRRTLEALRLETPSREETEVTRPISLLVPPTQVTISADESTALLDKPASASIRERSFRAR